MQNHSSACKENSELGSLRTTSCLKEEFIWHKTILSQQLHICQWSWMLGYEVHAWTQ